MLVSSDRESFPCLMQATVSRQLSEEQAARQEFETQQHLRMKEIQKRYAPILGSDADHVSIWEMFKLLISRGSHSWVETILTPPYRFKLEHEGKTSAEMELAQLREQRLGMEQQVWALSFLGGAEMSVILLQLFRFILPI